MGDCIAVFTAPATPRFLIAPGHFWADLEALKELDLGDLVTKGELGKEPLPEYLFCGRPRNRHREVPS
jgi:hypothetical protein